MEHLTLAQLHEEHKAAQDESRIAELEEEIAQREGFASADEWWDHVFSQPDNHRRVNSYTTRSVQQDAEDLKQQPFYLTDGQIEISSLCDFCGHLDFRYMLSNLIPRNELSLGLLKTIIQRQDCAFCRLVVASIQLALRLDDASAICADGDVEVGLMSSRKSDGMEHYDLEILLHPGLPNGQPSIRIQRLGTGDSCSAFDGRLIDPPQIDFKLAKTWLHDCECNVNRHTLADARSRELLFAKQPQKSTQPSFTTLQLNSLADLDFVPSYLIDVIENRVMSPRNTCRYLALSYVWGGPQPLQLQMHNVDTFRANNALHAQPADVPATIRDAMQLVRELGERYLWIDALCIVQDDHSSKQRELPLMDRVYMNAALTIIASHGASVHAGLPGVRAGTRNAIQHVESVQGTKLVNRLLRNEGTVDRSVWNSRAWTYQERILARRKLFVSEQQVTFKCEHTEVELCEDVYSLPFRPSQRFLREGEKWTSRHHSLDEAIPFGSVNTEVYASIVHRFTSRSVTYPADILNAFAGVSRQLTRIFRGDLLFGLPTTELDTQLLWQPLGAIKRRIDPSTGLEIFPSWSWAGWVGPVTGNAAGRQSVSSIELRQDGTGGWTTMDEFRGASASSSSPEWQSFQWHGSTFWHEIDREDTFFAHPVLEIPTSQPQLLPNAHGSEQILPLRASIASFHINGSVAPTASAFLVSTRTRNVSNIGALCLLDRTTNAWCGTVFVPSSIATDLSPGDYDCIEISRSGRVGDWDDEGPSCLMPFDPCFDHAYYDQFEAERTQVDVLVVRYEGNVAVRVGAGMCHSRAFDGARAERREVLLG